MNHDRGLEELQAELEACEYHSRKLRALIAMYDEVPAKRKVPRSSPVPASLFDRLVTEIMNEVGHPMSREDIRDELAKKGLVFRGRDPINTIATKLYRSARFRSIQGHGYWLVGGPTP